MTINETTKELKEEWNKFLKDTSLDNPRILKKHMAENEELRKVVEANTMAIRGLNALKKRLREKY